MMSSWKKGRVQWRFRAKGNHPPALFSHFETLRQNSRWRWRAGGRQEACSHCRFRTSRWWSSWSLIIWAGGRQEACSKSETVGRFLAFRDAHAFFTPPRFRMTRIWTEIWRDSKCHKALKSTMTASRANPFGRLSARLGPSEFRSNLDNFEQKHKKCV